ncbi:hypothetical protein MMC13_005248 [Lambiella insularis]|nr:hypothetical protein [Lambiella insularis]
MALDLIARVRSYTEPTMYVGFALYDWALVIGSAVLTFDLHTLRILSELKARAFAKFWLAWGPQFTTNENESAVPSLVASAYGTVLELGPGSGNQLPRMDRSKITKIYGVEPVASLHPALRLSIKKNKLDDVYQIVPCGIEAEKDIKKYGVAPGSIDTILSVQVLCSVPYPEEDVRRLYKLLKPGGQLVIYEHVGNNDAITAFVQSE